MRILIDGYNLLAVSGHSGREAILLDLSRYKAIRQHDVTIVFDGTRGGTRDGSRYRTGDVEVIFSPLTVLADETLEQLLESGAFQGAVVVSSDRRVQKAALRAHSSYAESHEFTQRLRQALSGEERESHSRGQPGRRQSKTDSERFRKLKKL